jgi:hypothetical protein
MGMRSSTRWLRLASTRVAEWSCGVPGIVA